MCTTTNLDCGTIGAIHPRIITAADFGRVKDTIDKIVPKFVYDYGIFRDDEYLIRSERSDEYRIDITNYGTVYVRKWFYRDTNISVFEHPIEFPELKREYTSIRKVNATGKFAYDVSATPLNYKFRHIVSFNKDGEITEREHLIERSSYFDSSSYFNIFSHIIVKGRRKLPDVVISIIKYAITICHNRGAYKCHDFHPDNLIVLIGSLCALNDTMEFEISKRNEEVRSEISLLIEENKKLIRLNEQHDTEIYRLSEKIRQNEESKTNNFLIIEDYKRLMYLKGYCKIHRLNEKIKNVIVRQNYYFINYPSLKYSYIVFQRTYLHDMLGQCIAMMEPCTTQYLCTAGFGRISAQIHKKCPRFVCEYGVFREDEYIIREIACMDFFVTNYGTIVMHTHRYFSTKISIFRYPVSITTSIPTDYLLKSIHVESFNVKGTVADKYDMRNGLPAGLLIMMGQQKIPDMLILIIKNVIKICDNDYARRCHAVHPSPVELICLIGSMCTMCADYNATIFTSLKQNEDLKTGKSLLIEKNKKIRAVKERNDAKIRQLNEKLKHYNDSKKLLFPRLTYLHDI